MNNYDKVTPFDTDLERGLNDDINDNLTSVTQIIQVDDIDEKGSLSTPPSPPPDIIEQTPPIYFKPIVNITNPPSNFKQREFVNLLKDLRLTINNKRTLLVCSIETWLILIVITIILIVFLYINMNFNRTNDILTNINNSLIEINKNLIKSKSN